MVDEFPTISVNEVDELLIHSYPNPASTRIYLSDQVEKVLVYDARGKLVSELKQTQEVDVRRLEAGTYFVEYRMHGKVGKDTWVIMK